MTSKRRGRLGSGLKSIDYFLGIERVGTLISTRTLWRRETDKNCLALTFDDGPHPVATPKLLNILDREGLTATFFLIGRNVVRFPDVVDQIQRAGHEIGNHTFNHPNLTRLPDEAVAAEIDRCEAALSRHTGASSRFFRPPRGLFSTRVLNLIESRNLRSVIGDVYPRDVHLSDPGRISRRVLARVGPGSIIILHDGSPGGNIAREATLAAVARLIPALRNRGYEMMGLTALLNT